MKKIYLSILLLVFISTSITAQHSQKTKNYRPEREKINDLVHTKLSLSFDFEKSQMPGEAWITLKPHFYKTNKVTLDANAMLIHEVKVNGKKAPYNYSEKKLTITLDKTYTRNQKYTVYIKYTARPEYVKSEGSRAITDEKGLYFIDPKDEDPNKPTQIWTQGETESSSCWFPTIDSPNQKTTEEIYLRVPKKFVTLSNGTLINSKENNDGTRTDYWKQTQKHAPYLFFIGVGEFSIVKDTWKGKEVNYYVEKEYEPFARQIFGDTPEMIELFSNLTGVAYPWDKYSQIVCRDYVSGAMENTTAVIHGEVTQQKAGQLIDKNLRESTIAHELFHHWFGDLVTAESWSNITVNESFANYSEYLWFEHKYGKDAADAHMNDERKAYKMSASEAKDLVRFHYKDEMDMFDAVSYNKGGAILHMLRNILGDEAFFAGLNKYLTDNMYGTGEAHQLRLAMEAVSGKDLNWFFNQWYFGNGHIKFETSYVYNQIDKSVSVTIKQAKKVFKFPLDITIYEKNGIVNTHKVWVDKKEKTFTFNYSNKPNLITLDEKGILLADITDSKTTEDYVYQYNNAKPFAARANALEEIVKTKDKTPEVVKTIAKALNDPYYELRIKALKNIDLSRKYNKKGIIKTIERLAKNDSKTLVKAQAIDILGKLINPTYRIIFENAISGTSNAMAGAGLTALYYLDKKAALHKAKELSNEKKESVANALAGIFINEKDKTELPFLAKHVLKGMFFSKDINVQNQYKEVYQWITESNNALAFKNLTADFVKMGKKYKQYGFDKGALNFMRKMIDTQKASNNSNKEELITIIKTAMSKLVE